MGNGKPVTLGYEYGWDLLHRNVESPFQDVPKVHQGHMLTEGICKLKPSLLVNNNSGTTTTQDSVCGTKKELSTGKVKPLTQ